MLKQSLQWSAVLNEEKQVKFLKLFNRDYDIDQYLLRREIANIFGSGSILNLLKTKKDNNYSNGGYTLEFTLQNINILKTFKDLVPSNFKDSLQEIIDILGLFRETEKKELKLKKILDLLGNDRPLMFTAGYKQHALTVIANYISKEDKYEITLLERNGNPHFLAINKDEKIENYNNSRLLFVKQIENPHLHDKVHPRKIICDYDNFLEVIRKLLKLRNSGNAKDFSKFLTEIKNYSINNEFTFDTQIAKKIFKEPVCYYENPKFGLFTLFIKKFGLSQGKMLNKIFQIFSHFEAISKYKEFSTDPNEIKSAIISHANEVIEDKIEKLINEKYFSQMQKLYPEINNFMNLFLNTKESLKIDTTINQNFTIKI